jgi:hypothetical protein
MDRELALIISEMLIKQDETTEQIKETNSILKDFMGISVKQWEQQQIFNERIVDGLKEVNGELKEIKVTLSY